MTCPACNSHTSAVWNAYNEGLPCPNCSLPANATMEIFKARQNAANEKLIAKYTLVARDLGAVREELAWYHHAFQEISDLVDRHNNRESP